VGHSLASGLFLPILVGWNDLQMSSSMQCHSRSEGPTIQLSEMTIISVSRMSCSAAKRPDRAKYP